tara:strand:- start:719 stop:1195 length:477 start_codon:yes stop_codon:yes gene_type:complete
MDEISVFNNFRNLLKSTDIDVLQLVPPGGQAPLSLTYESETTQKKKIIFPDFLGINKNNILLGELKPKFSKDDFLKLKDFQKSKDGYRNLLNLLKRRSSLNFSKLDIAVHLLLIHSQVSAIPKESIKQVIFLTNSKFIFLSENKKETHNSNISIVELF